MTMNSNGTSNNTNGICRTCAMNPCVWVQHYESVLGECKEWKNELEEGTGHRVLNNTCRKFCYRTFSQIIDGFLGQSNRKKLPSCVEQNVRRIFPNENGAQYMGFKSE